MSRLYLGIDTSNYRTSVALFNAADGTYENCGALVEVPAGMAGLRQSDALFQHTQRLPEQIAQLTKGCAQHISAIGVSTRPRAVEGSYMPCFLAGMSVAHSVAHLLGVPCYEASHQQGHLAAAAFGAGCAELLDTSFLAWHLSGGTTELLLVTPDTQPLPRVQILGGTNDISAGQLIDRTGVLLGLPFPAGPAMEQTAQTALPCTPFRVKHIDCSFSLSGMQNKIEEMHNKAVPHDQIAAFAIETVFFAIKSVTAHALSKHPVPVLCAGGVMSNTYIRQQMRTQFHAHFAPPTLSGDNAVGLAL